MLVLVEKKGAVGGEYMERLGDLYLQQANL